MINIMCFGDSNTHGFNPKNGFRYDKNTRWTGRLQKMLGDEYNIIEEGMNGRTVSIDDNIGVNKNGKKQLPTLLTTHKPLDLVVVMLGTNDLKVRFSMTARDIALSMEDLIVIIKNFYQPQTDKAPKILLVAPVSIASETESGESFGDQREKSKKLTPLYKELAERYNIDFMSLVDIVEPSPVDGIHMSEESHEVVANAMYEKIKSIAL